MIKRIPANAILLAIFVSLLDVEMVRAAKLPEFPKPDPAGAFAEMKIFGTNGSPIRVPLEDWTGAKLRVESDPKWREWVTEHRQRLEDQLPGPFTIYHAQTPDYPPAQREVLYIETLGKEAILLTKFLNHAEAERDSKPARGGS